MFKTTTLGLLAVGAMALTTLPATAQSRGNCAPHEQVVELLADRWGESRQSIALSSQGAVIETFASEETGTWTITMTNPGGPTCLVASGQAYQEVAEALPQRDQAS